MGGAGIAAILGVGLAALRGRTVGATGGATGFGGAIIRGVGGDMAATFGAAILGAISLGGGGTMARFGLVGGLGAAANFAGRWTAGFARRIGARVGGVILGATIRAWGGLVVDGVLGSIRFGVCFGARALTIGCRVKSGGNITFDFGGSFGGGSRAPRCPADAKGADEGPVSSGVKGRSILGKVRSGPSLSKTVRSTMTLGRLDPGE